jgi:endonuclease YncB( thermonuclease family)
LEGTVTKVVDGDTLDINGTRIRLAIVDTPERGQPGMIRQKILLNHFALVKRDSWMLIVVSEEAIDTAGKLELFIVKG